MSRTNKVMNERIMMVLQVGQTMPPSRTTTGSLLSDVRRSVDKERIGFERADNARTPSVSAAGNC